MAVASLPRQVQKTIDSVLYSEKVPYQKVIGMLKALGFEFRSGEHGNWRHPEGHRVTFPNGTDKEIWGYKLKDVRTVLKTMGYGEKEDNMAIEGDYTRTRVKSEAVRDYMDKKAIAEKKLPSVSVIDLTIHNQQMALKALSDGFNQIVSQLNSLEAVTQSIQDYLIELGCKLDEIKSLPAERPLEIKKEFTPEERKEILKQAGQKGGQKRRLESINRINKAIQENPQFKDNLKVIASIAGTSVENILKYRLEGLL